MFPPETVNRPTGTNKNEDSQKATVFPHMLLGGRKRHAVFALGTDDYLLNLDIPHTGIL